MNEKHNTNKYSLSKYDAHINIESIGLEGQFKIRDSKVLVVGAGGLGCPALEYLIAAGIGTIGIVDGDTISLSNLQRQTLYDVKDIGKSKAESASEKLMQRALGQKVVTHTCYLTRENAEEIISHYDYVIDATDNIKARSIINELCYNARKPWVFAAADRFQLQLMVFNNKNTATPCFKCLFSFDEKDYPERSCESTGILSSVTGVAATLQVTELLKFITGVIKYEKSVLLSLNLLNMSLNKTVLEKRKNCHVCSADK